MIKELKKNTHSLDIDYGGNFLGIHKGRSEKIIKHIKNLNKIWVCKREDIAHHWYTNFYE